MGQTSRETEVQPGVLDTWLAIATRGLCDNARERVSAEIRQHVAVAIDDCRARGVQDADALQQAERDAVASLGNPSKARREFKKTHLTKREAALLSLLTDGRTRVPPMCFFSEAALRCRNSTLHRACCLRSYPVRRGRRASTLYGPSDLPCRDRSLRGHLEILAYRRFKI